MNERARSIHDRIMQARRAPDDGQDASAVALGIAGGTTPRRRWPRPLLYALAGIVLIAGIGGGVVWQYPIMAASPGQGGQATGKPQPASQAPQTSNSQSPTPSGSSDPFRALAEQVGARSCAAAYAGLGKALTDGARFMVQTQAAKADADRHALQGIVGMTFQNGKDGAYSGSAAGLVFAAPTAQGCEGTMVRVVPFAQNCQAAAALLPRGSQMLQPLADIPVYALATGGQTMLLPAGGGCVAISIIRAGA